MGWEYVKAKPLQLITPLYGLCRGNLSIWNISYHESRLTNQYLRANIL